MKTKHHVTRVVAGAVLSAGVAAAGLGLTPATANAFNPQPDPPGRHLAALVHRLQNLAERVGFNPQPDPPGRPIDGRNR